MQGPRVARLAVAGLVLLAAGAAPVMAQERVIVAFGDSLTAGFGVSPDEAWPALVEARLRREGYLYRVVNAGVSGDTTAGALRRLDWVRRARPEVAIVALGANDGLRGQPLAAMRDNLIAIVSGLRDGGTRVLLAGMQLPRNYGAYAREFAGTYSAVAKKAGVALMPFLLDGVAMDIRLNQADGVHPNAEGHRVIAERVWPFLTPLLARP
jgi:acyl-CoA thioesterase-1